MYKRLKYPAAKYYKRSLWYYEQVGLPELAPVVQIAEEIRHNYLAAINHGDVTPWHMLKVSKRKFCLVDGEMASSVLPCYYDLAFFYQRVFTVARQPEFARAVVSAVREGLSKQQRREFDQRFRFVMAERIMGSYWDHICAAKKSEKTLKYHRLLRQALLNNNLY